MCAINLPRKLKKASPPLRGSDGPEVLVAEGEGEYVAPSKGVTDRPGLRRKSIRPLRQGWEPIARDGAFGLLPRGTGSMLILY